MTELIQALIAAGMATRDATRVAAAIMSLLPRPAAATPPAAPPRQVKERPPRPVDDGGIAHRQAVFDCPVTINGEVNWNGPRDPTTIQVLCGLETGAGGDLIFDTRQVAVLNDYGDSGDFAAGRALTASISAESRYVTVSASTSEKTALSGGTVELLGATVTVLVGATFDAENCLIVGETAAVFNCTGATLHATTYSMTVVEGVAAALDNASGAGPFLYGTPTVHLGFS